MRRTVLLLMIATIFCCLFICPAGAKKETYKRVAELTATGGPKEVALSQQAKWCMIRVMSGTVIINTIVVREGTKKTPVKVAVKLTKGDKHVIDIGPKRPMTGLRISDDGGGVYRVYLQK